MHYTTYRPSVRPSACLAHACAIYWMCQHTIVLMWCLTGGNLPLQQPACSNRLVECWVSCPPTSEGNVSHLRGCSVFFFFFFSRGCLATAGRIFTKSSPKDVFVVLFSNGGAPMKFGSPKNFGGFKMSSHFLSENSNSAFFERPLHGNEEQFLKN